MRIYRCLLCFTAVLAAFHGRGQYDAMFTNYMFNEMFINPAYAGSKEAMSATMLHRQQWVNFPGRPVTTSFSLHGPLQGEKMGLGLSVLSERIGVLNRSLIYGSYAYRMRLHDGHLALGLMGGLENQMNRFGTLRVNNDASAPSDPQFSQNTPNIMAPNFGAGIFYSNEKYYAGISVPRMIDNTVKFNPAGATVKTARLASEKFTYYITGGYLFNLKSNLMLRANAMLKAVKNAPAQVDLGASVLVNQSIWAGLSYRSNSSLSLLLGYQASKQFLVCYSYDYGLNKIQRYSQGSHEIVLNYLFSFTNNKKIVTPRYF